MRRGRLVKFSGHRRILVGVERVGVAVPVPTNDVEGVVLDDIDGVPSGVGDTDLVLAPRIDRRGQDRNAKVTFIVRRVLGELPEFVAELLGDRDVSARLVHDQPSRRCRL